MVLFYIFLMVLAGSLIGILDAIYQATPYKNRKVSKHCEISRNSDEAAKLIDDFLTDRLYACNFRMCRRKKTKTIGSGWNSTKVVEWVIEPDNSIRNPELIFRGEGIRRFNRLAHLLGCEIIIRQIGVTNSDDKDAKQVKTSMKQEYYYRDSIIKIQ